MHIKTFKQFSLITILSVLIKYKVFCNIFATVRRFGI